MAHIRVVEYRCAEKEDQVPALEIRQPAVGLQHGPMVPKIELGRETSNRFTDDGRGPPDRAMGNLPDMICGPMKGRHVGLSKDTSTDGLPFPTADRPVGRAGAREASGPFENPAPPASHAEFQFTR